MGTLLLALGGLLVVSTAVLLASCLGLAVCDRIPSRHVPLRDGRGRRRIARSLTCGPADAHGAARRFRLRARRRSRRLGAARASVTPRSVSRAGRPPRPSRSRGARPRDARGHHSPVSDRRRGRGSAELARTRSSTTSRVPRCGSSNTRFATRRTPQTARRCISAGRGDPDRRVDDPERRRSLYDVRPALRRARRVSRDRRDRAKTRARCHGGRVRSRRLLDVHDRRAADADGAQRPRSCRASRRLRVLRHPPRASRPRPRGPGSRARGRHEADDAASPCRCSSRSCSRRIAARTWPALGVAGIAGLAGGSVWYYVNLVVTGKLDGGLSAMRSHRSPTAPWGRRSTGSDGCLVTSSRCPAPKAGAGSARRHPVWSSGSSSPSRPESCFSVRRRRAAGAAALVAVSAVVLYPMLATWVDVAGRASRQALVTAHLSPIILPPRACRCSSTRARSTPRTESRSCCSSSGSARSSCETSRGGAYRWLPQSRSRRRCSSSSCSRLSLEYDPIRIRFVAFPVALATAVLGICVRVRPLAWTAVGLTAATLAVVVAYFVPRPAGLALLPGNRTPRAVGALVRAGRWRRGRRERVPVPRGEDPGGRDDRARPRPQHVHLPGVGRGTEADCPLRPGHGRRA